MYSQMDLICTDFLAGICFITLINFPIHSTRVYTYINTFHASSTVVFCKRSATYGAECLYTRNFSR